MTQELSIFKDLDLSEEEERKIGETPHRVLLERAFGDLVKEVDGNGNSARLELLRREHAKVLISYWKRQYLIYGATGQGKKGERLDVSFVTGISDERILLMNRQTPTERDEVRIAINIRGEVDEVYPPTISSEVKTDSDEPSYDVRYKVTFGIGRQRFLKDGSLRIDEFMRERVHEDPEHQRSVVYDTRTLR